MSYMQKLKSLPCLLSEEFSLHIDRYFCCTSHDLHNRTYCRLSDNDVVLTTYNIVNREIPITEQERKDKHLHEMPATDQV